MSSADDDRRRFDPRFDPAFQPGYSPRNDPTIAARATGRQGDIRIDLDTRMPSQPPAPVQAPPPLDATSRGRPRAQETDEVDDEFEETNEAPDASGQSRAINPFHVALWVLSLVLIVAGIVLYRALPGLYSSLEAAAAEGDAGISYFQIDAVGGISAALLGVGFATAAGALALHATRWRSRPTNRSVD